MTNDYSRRTSLFEMFVAVTTTAAATTTCIIIATNCTSDNNSKNGPVFSFHYLSSNGQEFFLVANFLRVPCVYKYRVRGVIKSLLQKSFSFGSIPLSWHHMHLLASPVIKNTIFYEKCSYSYKDSCSYNIISSTAAQCVV
jgi:hypothetical protein